MRPFLTSTWFPKQLLETGAVCDDVTLAGSADMLTVAVSLIEIL
jgi:hypothetical protein